MIFEDPCKCPADSYLVGMVNMTALTHRPLGWGFRNQLQLRGRHKARVWRTAPANTHIISSFLKTLSL